MAQVATPNRRRHSLEVEVPSKTLRRSQEHLSPGQHSAQYGYGPSAIPVADADHIHKRPYYGQYHSSNHGTSGLYLT